MATRPRLGQKEQRDNAVACVLRFNTFEWEKYDNGNMPSPYKPQVRGA